MIYERSCDTEDWSYDAENSALHHRSDISKYIKIEHLNCINIQSITAFTLFMIK